MVRHFTRRLTLLLLLLTSQVERLGLLRLHCRHRLIRSLMHRLSLSLHLLLSLRLLLWRHWLAVLGRTRRLWRWVNVLLLLRRHGSDQGVRLLSGTRRSTCAWMTVGTVHGWSHRFLVRRGHDSWMRLLHHMRRRRYWRM